MSPFLQNIVLASSILTITVTSIIFIYFVLLLGYTYLQARKGSRLVNQVDNYQSRCAEWHRSVFTKTEVADAQERNRRVLEEALELVRSLGLTEEMAHALVSYEYKRPMGDPMQEIGGLQTTVMILAEHHGYSVGNAMVLELNRIKRPDVRAKIRQKQDLKNQAGIGVGHDQPQ